MTPKALGGFDPSRHVIVAVDKDHGGDAVRVPWEALSNIADLVVASQAGIPAEAIDYMRTLADAVNGLGAKVHQLETDALRCRQMESDMARLLEALSRYEVDETSGRLRKVG